MRKAVPFFVPAIVLAAWFGLTACERILSGPEMEAVLAFSEASTDNLLAGWTAGDYAVFAREFDADLQEEIPASVFADLKRDMDNELGGYISRSVEQVTQADEFYVVTYSAKFEHAQAVKFSVAFHASDHSIAHLGFESDNMSWSAFE